MKKIVKKSLALLLCAAMLITPVSMTALAASEKQMKNTVIAVANAEVGYTESAPGVTKYGSWYGYQGAWCTTFVLWCFNQAGNQLGVKLYGNAIPSGGNCNSMISWFQNKGRYHTRASGYTPKKGDLIFFDWSGNGSSQHVGIVRAVNGNAIYTIEGNCSGKVKAKGYYPDGSRPYRSTYSIMGYGSPNWTGSPSGGKSGGNTTKKATTQKQTATQKKSTTKKKSSAKKKSSKKKSTRKKAATTAKSTAAATTKSAKKKSKKATTKKATTTKKKLVAKDMELYAATTELEVGDSVDLNYSIKPKGAQAVVGYFCDEENVIQISQGGVITATGEGKATVVVCANDEIYKQCDFTVTEVSHDATRLSPEKFDVETTLPIQDKTPIQKLNDIGINVEKLKSHAQFFIFPAGIVGVTGITACLIAAIKAIASAIRRKKENKENE